MLNKGIPKFPDEGSPRKINTDIGRTREIYTLYFIFYIFYIFSVLNNVECVVAAVCFIMKFN